MTKVVVGTPSPSGPNRTQARQGGKILHRHYALSRRRRHARFDEIQSKLSSRCRHRPDSLSAMAAIPPSDGFATSAFATAAQPTWEVVFLTSNPPERSEERAQLARHGDRLL